jgi:hypothetical protein
VRGSPVLTAALKYRRRAIQPVKDAPIQQAIMPKPNEYRLYRPAMSIASESVRLCAASERNKGDRDRTEDHQNGDVEANPAAAGPADGRRVAGVLVRGELVGDGDTLGSRIAHLSV